LPANLPLAFSIAVADERERMRLEADLNIRRGKRHDCSIGQYGTRRQKIETEIVNAGRCSEAGEG
jgi:hypothetical protein